MSSEHGTGVLNAIWCQFMISVRLQLRSRTAFVFSYALPLVFLATFVALYRHDSPPLWRHMDELLTITALSSACFGLPSWLVSERERGVWRRYRLAPVPLVVHLAGILGAAYVVQLSAGMLQIGAARAIGTPLPAHAFDVWIVFTIVAAAFLTLGLFITVLGNTVPAAQALGQVVFLPMLILGGVAVPLENLPDWVRQLAGAMPGRYAVEALEGALAGKGVVSVAPALAALATIAAGFGAASLALFRWDAGQRLVLRRALAPVALAAACCVGVSAFQSSPKTPGAIPTAAPPQQQIDAEAGPASFPTRDPELRQEAAPRSVTASLSPGALPPLMVPPPASTVFAERTWRDVTMDDVNLNVVFVGLPPDHGVVTPIDVEYRRREDVECIRRALAGWPPAAVEDVVQRGRNVLLVAAVPDVLQLDIERDVPLVTFAYLQQGLPKDDLVKVLYWIVTHPSEGDLDALDTLSGVCLAVQPPDDAELIRERIAMYATKLLGRLTGKITS